MNFIRSLFQRASRKNSKASKGLASRRYQARPRVEALEHRNLPSGYTISGHVFFDVNNNGLMDSGEQVLANAPIELRNAQNVVIGNAISDANGFYSFDHDNTVGTAPLTLTKTLTFPSTPTNFALSGTVAQFNPALGDLISVDIINAGSITSDIRVENTSSSSSSSINATVAGKLTLTGPGGVNIQTNLSQNAGTYSAAIYDGQLDFAGASGKDFGNKTATGSQTTTLTGSAMAAFIGTGNVQLTETADASSTAVGGGNLLVGVTSTGAAQITVVYKYTPSNALQPGNYTVIKTADPPTYFDGKESRNGTVLGNPPGTSVIPLTLSEGDMPNNDFGELKASTLSGYVWGDISQNGFNDGVKQAGESGISGVTVKLDGTDDNGAIHLTTTTDASGFYQFGNLRPGSYALTEIQPSGWTDGKDSIGTPGGATGNDGFSNINLASGFNGVNNNFGEIKLSQLSGYVYADVGPGGFNDGIKQGSEAGIAGVSITLDGMDERGAVHAVATTDSNGYYQFSDLHPGTYIITETQPSGWIDGKDTIGTPGGGTSNDQFTNIVLPAAVSGANNNFGETRFGQLSGYVWADTGAGGFNDGIKQAGEAGISGVTVNLDGTDDTGVVHLTTTTDSDGFYQFSNLHPGTYILSEVQPAGWTDGKDTIGTPGGITSNDQFANISLPAGGTGTNNNFGEVKLSSLSGFVYGDISAGGFNDGVKQASETGIAGVTIQLNGADDSGTFQLSTTTDSNGAYQFNNLRPGVYTISEIQPAGWGDGKDTIGTPGGNTSNDQFTGINLGAGFNGVNNNFGEIKFAQLSGTVYYDGSATGYNNGVQDPTEYGIANVTIQLTGIDSQGHSVSATTTTDSLGRYQFANLQPGSYTIVEVQPFAFMDGKDTVGTLSGTVSNDQFANINLAPAGSGANYNFGEILPSTISGWVYVDTGARGYNDGIRQAGEQGIAGVLITLTGTNDLGQVNMQTRTDSGGLYSFNGLRPGVYTITEAQPESFLDGKDTIGVVGGQTGNDVFSNIVLGSYVNDYNNNFGELTPVILVSHEPELPKDVDPNPPIFVTPPLTNVITSKGQLLASTANNVVVSAATASDARFINSLYTSLLGRSVEENGLSAWLGYLRAGGTRRGLVDGIWNSPEHRWRQINALYQSFLGTTASQATLNYYTTLFQSGASEFDVAAAIASSPQATALYPNASDYVIKLFDVALGRTPDPVELAAWSQFPGDRATEARAILLSAESLNGVVQRAFLQVLNRPANAAELNNRVAQLQTTGKNGFAAFIDDLFTSQEFAILMGS